MSWICLEPTEQYWINLNAVRGVKQMADGKGHLYWIGSNAPAILSKSQMDIVLEALEPLFKNDSASHLNSGDKNDSASHLSIAGALALLSEPKAAPKLTQAVDVEVLEGEMIDEKRLDNPDAHDTHLTPPPIKTALAEFWPSGIDLDPCSNSKESPNIPARVVYTLEDNGLQQSWAGAVYVNPPYSGKHGTTLEQWARKMLLELELAQRTGKLLEIVALLPNYSSEAWWALLDSFPHCTIRGRLVFLGVDGKPQPSGARFPSVLVYLGGRVDEFKRCFGALGRIWLPME